MNEIKWITNSTFYCWNLVNFDTNILIIFNRAIGNASPSISAIAEGQSAAHRLFQIINRKPKIDITDTSGIVLDDIKGDVELNNVFFRYPARPEQLILNGLSLQVPNGTTMAIVGESGSGKLFLFEMVSTPSEIWVDATTNFLRLVIISHIRKKGKKTVSQHRQENT